MHVANSFSCFLWYETKFCAPYRSGYKFLSLFRAKIWWMIPRVGKSGCGIPIETQMLLLEARQEFSLLDETSSERNTENTFYILFLPVLDGQFRTSLQGSPENDLQLCVESGQLAHLVVSFSFTC